jgi:hypothetical protein
VVKGCRRDVGRSAKRALIRPENRTARIWCFAVTFSGAVGRLGSERMVVIVKRRGLVESLWRACSGGVAAAAASWASKSSCAGEWGKRKNEVGYEG